ncbi:ATP-binding protein [Sphingomonas immobilis]|uniref:histidine kinase n=1 Tax=Sphingomonas immobilis TaxID=3063997 RepID=A0ABT8ZT04_9SPHN|nr:ATP-binding protein [Sphingomonas sp. CA1-15]MDO7840700.1 ATP-binding protein [Sphingomonas sp. CA1-15]
MSLGLLGRLLIILLLTVVVEFSASTLLYERASELSLQEDEAHRLAEHLVVARKLLDERPPPERPRIARELVTDRYVVGWTVTPPSRSSFRPQLASMQRQIVAWEPDLARSKLQLRLPPLQDGSSVHGALRLADGSWLTFQMKEALDGGWKLSVGRVLRAFVPALLLLVFSGLLIRSTIAPLRTLMRAARLVGLGTRVPVKEAGSPEVRSLIHAFNEMQDRIHDLLESRTQALASVSHDLRTPLARLQLRIDEVADDALREELVDDVAEMNDMITSLLAFYGGQADPEKPALTDLAVLTSTLVERCADRGFDATYRGPDHLEMTLRSSAIRRAISNLIENALHYGGCAHVTLDKTATEIVLRVEDNGPGIPEDKLADVLEPFTRLDDARARNTGGLGLGLAIVARVVGAEKGVLTLANRPEGGLRATITLNA